MRYMTKALFEKQMERIKAKNKSLEYQKLLKEEKRKYGFHLKKPTTNKLMAFYLFVILNVIVVYALIAMWHFGDLSYLGALITDIAGQVIVYYIYAKKATIENSKGGITYEMAMLEKQNEFNNENEVG